MPRDNDPHYHVEGVPPAIRAKITQLIGAAHDAGLAGSYDDPESIREYEKICRMNLEVTIMTHLKKLNA